MTIIEAKTYISNITSHITFEYKGKNCGVDPFSEKEFDIWYGEDGLTVDSIHAVMTVKIFDGKSLEEIWDHITGLEY